MTKDESISISAQIGAYIAKNAPTVQYTLDELAAARGQTLAQLALVWTLRRPAVTSALIGASKPEQIVENVKALENMSLTEEELSAIDLILAH